MNSLIPRDHYGNLNQRYAVMYSVVVTKGIA